MACSDCSFRRLVFAKLRCYAQDRCEDAQLPERQLITMYDDLLLEPESPTFGSGEQSPSAGSSRSKRRRVAPSGPGWYHGPEKGRALAEVPSFQAPCREVRPAHLQDDEIDPELVPLMARDHPLYGLFSYVVPPEWSELRLLCDTHPVALPFLRRLSEHVERLRPGAQFLQRAQGNDKTVPAYLSPLLSVVTQLVSFYVTYRCKTNLSFDRFASCFASGGLLGLGPAVLVALAVSAACGGEDEGDEDFVSTAQTACHLALLLGQELAAHHATLPPGSPGQSYVLQVHNISRPVLDACLTHTNGRYDAVGTAEISLVLASRSFYISGHPADLESLRALLRSLARHGFKFGTRFLPFPGPVQSILNAPVAEALTGEFARVCFSRGELGLEVVSPVDGSPLRESDDLAAELVSILLLWPHCATRVHDALNFRAGVISFETTNIPNALGGHNLIVNQLLLTVPYMQCLSQPFAFKHTRPSLDDLHPRNNTREGRCSVLFKCAILNEIFQKLGSPYRCDLLASWLELGLLERRQSASPLSVDNSRMRSGRPSICSVNSASGTSCFLPSPASQNELNPQLLNDIAGDIEQIQHSSTLYNIERIEALGPDLTAVSATGKEFAKQLSRAAGRGFQAQLFWACPSVIYFVEYWAIMEQLGVETSPPLTPAYFLPAVPIARGSAQGTPGEQLPLLTPHAHAHFTVKRSGTATSDPAADASPRSSRKSSRKSSPPERMQVPNFALAKKRALESVSDRASVVSVPHLPDSPRTAARRRYIKERMHRFYSAVGGDA